MKRFKIFSAMAGLLLSMLATSCEGEKDLIILDLDLPIKTSTLYMVGDATPNGWDIGNPTALTATDEDPLVFTWEGELYTGEIKLCLTPGSWDSPFIRPLEHGTEIGKDPIVDAKFQMHAGDPDEKWRVAEAGYYLLSFNLRNWTMSTTYLRGADAPTIEPIETETLYIVGDATPNGWNIDAPTPLNKTGAFTFVYEGELTPGEMKACCTSGSWDVPFVRPASDGVKIGKGGVESNDFVYSNAPDHKWNITDAGIYRLTFDLENWTINSEFLGEVIHEQTPIEADNVYMVGDATPNGWAIDAPTVFTKESKYIFSWEGELVPGEMKACTQVGTWDQPFIRPSRGDVAISGAGVEAPDFVYTTGPDDKWKVMESGVYRITFDLEHYTIKVVKTGNGSAEPEPQPGQNAIETETLFLIGDATPGGWDMSNLTPLTRSADNKYVFTWTGNLKAGEMKACLEPDGSFSCPFIRPSVPDCAIDVNGVAAPDFVFTKAPDNKWIVKTAGRYTITFDLQKWTISAKYLD